MFSQIKTENQIKRKNLRVGAVQMSLKGDFSLVLFVLLLFVLLYWGYIVTITNVLTMYQN
jgi:hypothetical protein